jgi:hypothetical protein
MSVCAKKFALLSQWNQTLERWNMHGYLNDLMQKSSLGVTCNVIIGLPKSKNRNTGYHFNVIGLCNSTGSVKAHNLGYLRWNNYNVWNCLNQWKRPVEIQRRILSCILLIFFFFFHLSFNFCIPQSPLKLYFWKMPNGWSTCKIEHAVM